MKGKAILVLAGAFFFAVAALPVQAYTYTCEEGKFRIEVPEGWEAYRNESLEEGFQKGNAFFLNIYFKEKRWSISVLSVDARSREFLDGFGFNSESEVCIELLHDFHLTDVKIWGDEILKDEYLDTSTFEEMNVEGGFLLFTKSKDLFGDYVSIGGGFLASGHYYQIGGGMSIDDYTAEHYFPGKSGGGGYWITGEGVIKGILNSFRAIE